MKQQNKLIKYKEFLSLIAKSPKKLRNSIIKGCNKDHIHSIIECVLNITNGNVQLDEATFNKLKPYSRVFNKILDRNTDLKTKKKIIIQKGGFLPILIGAIVSGIASIISAAITKKNE
jgi:hypothetical protein